MRRLCALLGIGCSWYNERQERTTQAERDVALHDASVQIVLAFPGYGYRRVTKALAREGWPVNLKRVRRVMWQESLLCQLKRRFAVTTDSAHVLRTYPNLEAGFDLTGPDQAWVADITYIRLPTAFAYLACILDARSRCCVSWHVSRAIDAQLILAALEGALAARHPAPGLIQSFGPRRAVPQHRLCGTIGSRRSADQHGGCRHPYENAKAESFFKTHKREEVYVQQYQTFHEAEANLGRFIEDVYNTKRLHSSLGYLSPAEIEAGERPGG